MITPPSPSAAAPTQPEMKYHPAMDTSTAALAEPAAYTEAKRHIAASTARLPSLGDAADLDALGADLGLPEMDDILDGELALIGMDAGGDGSAPAAGAGDLDDLSLDLM